MLTAFQRNAERVIDRNQIKSNQITDTRLDLHMLHAFQYHVLSHFSMIHYISLHTYFLLGVSISTGSASRINGSDVSMMVCPSTSSPFPLF